jgi:hypothetical protein
MSPRSERPRAPRLSVGHVPRLLSSSGGQQGQFDDALLAGLDRETQNTVEPPGLLSGESTTHGKAFPAIHQIDDVSSSLLFSLCA